jgi:hypothetical protein
VPAILHEVHSVAVKALEEIVGYRPDFIGDEPRQREMDRWEI